MNDIAQIINNFEDALHKQGAKSKAKTKGQVDKGWKKSKESYSKLKSQYDRLKKESDKLNARLEATESLLTTAKQDMLHYYKMKQYVDLSGASSVVQYDNDTRDVGYVIDKEEYHLDLNDARDLVKSPMKAHKKNNKPKKEEAENQQDIDDIDDVDDIDDDAEDISDADDFLFDNALFSDDGWNDFPNDTDKIDTVPNFRFVDE